MARLANPTMVNVAEAEQAILELERTQGGTITLSEFLRLNLHRFKATGLSRRTIYDNLTRSGITLGTFAAFSKCWSWLESSGKVLSNATDNPVKVGVDDEKIAYKKGPEKGGERDRRFEQATRTNVKTSEEGAKKRSPALRPICKWC